VRCRTAASCSTRAESASWVHAREPRATSRRVALAALLLPTQTQISTAPSKSTYDTRRASPWVRPGARVLAHEHQYAVCGPESDLLGGLGCGASTRPGAAFTSVCACVRGLGRNVSSDMQSRTPLVVGGRAGRARRAGSATRTSTGGRRARMGFVAMRVSTVLASACSRGVPVLASCPCALRELAAPRLVLLSLPHSPTSLALAPRG